MVKRDVTETVFFILIFCLFCLSVKVVEMWAPKLGNQTIAIMLVGLIFTLVVVVAYVLAGLHKPSSEHFWDITPAATCQGGKYHWQGSSEQAQMCRAMASTPEGRCAISSYNCPTGTIGTPKIPFEYTPLSNDQWTNERCNKDEKLTCHNDGGTCGMSKQGFEGEYLPCSN